MRVLLVAPRTNLLLADEEVQDIANSGLSVSLLIGNVSRNELLRSIRAGNYDILWFATHGNGEGIELTDGLISTSELIPLIREQFRLVVLNSCASLLIAQQIQEEANVGVICTLVDIPDRAAYTTGSLLASNLANGKPISEAYRLSKPGGNRIYLYLPALSPAEDMIESLIAEIRDLREQLEIQTAALVKSNKRLWWLVAGIGAALTLSVFNLAWLLLQGG